jgi:hypothetical protein
LAAEALVDDFLAGALFFGGVLSAAAPLAGELFRVGCFPVEASSAFVALFLKIDPDRCV